MVLKLTKINSSVNTAVKGKRGGGNHQSSRGRAGTAGNASALFFTAGPPQTAPAAAVTPVEVSQEIFYISFAQNNSI